METIEKNIIRENLIPLCINRNLENYACNEKRYHILFIENGSGSISFSGHKELFMGPLLYCFNEKEHPLLTNTSNLQTKSLYLRPDFVNNRFTFENLENNSEQFTLSDIRDRLWFRYFFERSDDFYGRIHLSISTAKRLTKLFDVLEKQLEDQPDGYWPCRCRSFLIEILFLIEQCGNLKDRNNNLHVAEYSDDVEKIILYLYSNYSKKITIPDIASEFHIDRTTLTRKFKAEVGETIINCLNKLRINLSSDMLRDTSVPIAEIMYRVGFVDLSHFNRTFKKFTNFTPSEYRQKYNTLMN